MLFNLPAGGLVLNSVPTGKIVMDGTSYSGADIKAVVHVYQENGGEIYGLRDRISNYYKLMENLPEFEKIEIREKIQGVLGRIKELEQEGSRFTTKELAEIQTLSVSTYREKYPVRALSTTYPKGFTRGPRTVAGSIVFTVFDKNVLYELLVADPTEFDSDKVFSSILVDQLPPFDITLSFANELGQVSNMVIYGVEFVSEGQVMSIHDLFIENTVQFVARDIDPMSKKGDFRKRVLTPGTKSASDLNRESPAREYSMSMDPFERFKNRNTPFK